MRAKKSLFLVADAHVGKFYLVENLKISREIATVKVDDVCVHHQKPEGGRFPKSGHFFREYAPHTDPKEVDRSCFSRNLAHELHKLLEQEKYDQLILVCSTKILGGIRKCLPEHLLKTLEVTEVAKDLASRTSTELQKDVLDKMKFGHSE